MIGMAGALAALPSVAAAQKDPDAAGVAEAIRFERAKQAAADRQARIEEAKEHQAKRAERANTETKKKARVKTAEVQRTPPAEHPQ